ncbi:hypothetical protein VI817_004561 [Penicillium citrinum]|nr:hypothetical protein VI817_004561 [Penicillium citrinum]
MFLADSYSRCKRMGRICEGYRKTPVKPSVPRRLASVPTLISPIEQHALEVFFICTAPQLAGHFEYGFFQRRVLQLSLAEPAIRQAIAALGILHEQAAAKRTPFLHRETLLPELPIKLYNRAIQSIKEKVTAESPHLPFVAVVNVLFICFEYFQGNLEAAASHIRGGIGILDNWRTRNNKRSTENGNHRYMSLEAEFMETEIAPLLCTMNINAVQWGVGMHASLILDSAADPSDIIIPSRFESLKSARAALLNLVIFSTWQFEPFEMEPSSMDFPIICERAMAILNRWKVGFEQLVQREWHFWDEQERRMADAISAMRCNAELGIYSYQAQSDCDWEKYRSRYEETVGLVNKLASNMNHSPNDLSNVFSLDFRMIFPLQPEAWRCRWPHLHRMGMDLQDRLSGLDWLPSANHYNSVSSRTMEIEEAYLKFITTKKQTENKRYPDALRIQDHSVVILKSDNDSPPLFSVTFWSKADGLDGPWYSFTETVHLGPRRPDKVEDQKCQLI